MKAASSRRDGWKEEAAVDFARGDQIVGLFIRVFN
jgi:hypothetical protein